MNASDFILKMISLPRRTLLWNIGIFMTATNKKQDAL